MSISNILPTEINLLIIGFLKLQDVINLSSVNRYYHKITSIHLEKYRKFNKKCKNIQKEYRSYVTANRSMDLKNTIVIESVHLGNYDICEFIFGKRESIFYLTLQNCLLFTCDNNKTDIIQLVIDNWSKGTPAHYISKTMKMSLLTALCSHNRTNVLELISPYFDTDDHDKALSYILKIHNYSMFEALVAQDNFRLSDHLKDAVSERYNDNDISQVIVILSQYLFHRTTIDVIKNETESEYKKWLSIFETPYAINKIQKKKMIL